MKTFLSVKLAFLPFVTFWTLAGFGLPLPGTGLATVLALAALVWRRRRGGPIFLEAVAVATFPLLGFGYATTVPLLAGNAFAISFLALGLAFAASVVRGNPWTAAYAASAWQGVGASPLFLRINAWISGLWAGIFLYLGIATWLGLPPGWRWLPTAVGAVISIVLPPLWVRRALQRDIDGREPHAWPAPEFAARHGDHPQDVIVVGAGLGGLVAAALLAKAGLRVLVLEQHLVPGGFAHTWLRKGRDGDARPVFRFDSGVHDVSGWWEGAPVHGLLRRLGLEHRLEWLRLERRELEHGVRRDVPSTWDEYVALMTGRFPQEPGMPAALDAIRRMYEGMYSEAPANSGVPGAPRSVEGMLAFARRNPLLTRWMDRPFREFLASHLADPSARDALCALSGYITDDREAATVRQMVPLFGYYLHGGYYPLGGSGRIAEVLADCIAEHGGEVRLRTAVKRVIVEGGTARGVELEDGRRLASAAVVLNGDFIQATQGLVEPGLWPEEFRRVAGAARPACSAFCVHLGLRGKLDGERPLLHVRSELGEVGIVMPSVVDPGAATDGYSSIELVQLVAAEDAPSWFADPAAFDDREHRHSAAYEARKAEFGDRLIAIAEQALPGLAGRIVFRCDASPVTFRRYDWSSAGSIYGSVVPGRAIPSKSPIPGLLFAGAITHGPGVEAVFISGAMAAEALLPGLLARSGS